MGINLRVETIQTLLKDKVDCKTFEEVCDMLDDIRILSDAKDAVIKEWAANGVPTSENSLHKHIVMQRSEPLPDDDHVKLNGNGFNSLTNVLNKLKGNGAYWTRLCVVCLK